MLLVKLNRFNLTCFMDYTTSSIFITFVEARCRILDVQFVLPSESRATAPSFVDENNPDSPWNLAALLTNGALLSRVSTRFSPIFDTLPPTFFFFTFNICQSGVTIGIGLLGSPQLAKYTRTMNVKLSLKPSVVERLFYFILCPRLQKTGSEFRIPMSMSFLVDSQTVTLLKS